MSKFPLPLSVDIATLETACTGTSEDIYNEAYAMRKEKRRADADTLCKRAALVKKAAVLLQQALDI